MSTDLTTLIPLPLKDPRDEVDASINFAKRLAAGETISTATVTISVLDGVDHDPDAIMQGPPTVSGADVIQRLVGGVIGATYLVSFIAVTSRGQKRVVCRTLRVVLGGTP